MRHLVIGLLCLLAPLPLPWLRALGAGLGRVLFVLARARRHIALTNLRLCFPDLPEAERVAMARRSFVYFCQAALDRAWLWHGKPELLQRRVRVHGALHEFERDSGVIVFAPHFYGLDVGGSAIMAQMQRPGALVYAKQPDPVLDDWMRRGRERFGNVRAYARTDGLKPVVRALRDKVLLYLLPDMDLGPEESIFVPFFGIPTATVPSVSRLARMGHAPVLTVLTRITPTGYDTEVLPVWEGFPTDDVVADTALMNQRLQGYIATMPEQYYWVHKRFKTRPPGVPPVY
ncbi:lysophospholipid acyltransferase family protein [Ottowia sp.]|uniref:lysophospholipid acyltransferase family protein n=1 Tax=Ottowia sp. TaxID=1898956 RepID=UPI003A84FEC2